MMEGWYCRTIANQQTDGQQEDQNVNVDDDSGSDDSQTVQKPENDRAKQTNGDQVDYKAQYRYLKRKLKFLIYENEFFQDALRSNQRRLLKVSRDRAFLLDRLMQYEKPDDTSDSDVTESSEDEAKKRKTEPTTATAAVTANAATAPTTGATRGRKRKAPGGDTTKPHKTVMVEKKTTEAPMVAAPLNQQNPAQQSQQQQQLPSSHQPRQMTQAEVERHLQSRQTVLEMMPEQATATVPHEMFSNEPSLDGETQEQIVDESPQHVAAEECVAMEYAN